MIDFELYRIFVEVAKEGNITKASEKLNVSQPAITKKIKNLEEQLSMKLLERKSKGVELTLEGKKLYEKIKKPIEELNTIDRQVCKEKVINIGTHNHIGSCIFGNVLNKYYLKYPNVNLNLICEETCEMMRKLQNKELDIVFSKKDSNEVLNGINTLNSGASTLASGTNTLNNGVNTAKSEVSNSISSTNSELKKLNGLDEYTANPVKVEEKDVNEVSEYGTAFSPFFMSIALWVGSLMLFIILYYDANDRFKNCSRNAENKVKRTFCYLGLATLQGIILGILLLVGLKFSVTNYFLYFASLILVAWMFEAIMEFLIVHFGDIGKFLALILLVLQLAAAGGTFPIQTVYTGFQKLFNVLPMKYSIDLFKEALISIEGNLLSKSLIVIIIIFVVLFVINILKDIRLQKKASK